MFIAAPVQPKSALHLARDWDAAWREIVRPWLAAPAELRRDFVLVPTRGQAHALKLRCVRENLPLLGVEFLTPGLARQKWSALAKPARPALGRELLLLNLRALVEERLAPLAPEAPAWGWWKSLQRDPGGALDAFDELLQAGLAAQDFPLPALRDVFGELERRVGRAGYDFAARQNLAAATAPLADGARLGGRLLIYGFTAEHSREFFSLVALARHAPEVAVVLPEPAFGRKDHDERWVEAWEQMLGTEAVPVDAPATTRTGEAVAQLWTAGTGGPVSARVLVGHTRADEMQLVADEVARLLAAGAGNLAVIFPRAGASHLRLVRLLAARGLPFNDLLEAAGPVAIDTQLQRALLAFHEHGARLEELLALWPLLHATGHTTLAPGGARDVCERVFDARQTHSLATVLPDLAARERPEWREVARVAGLLLPAWPDRLTLADALARFAAVSARLLLPGAESWPALAAYAAQDRRELPLQVVVAALASFLPEKSPATGVPGRGLFAPVTLTTWRRAAALAWSDVIFTECNAGVWPVRAESGGWLADEHREELNRRARPGTALFTGDSRAWLERQGAADVAANTTGTVVFSAALFDEEEPELKLAPNAWLERVLLGGGIAEPAAGLEEQFSRLARKVVTPAANADAAAAAWFDIWERRRNPAAAFDDYFLCGDPGLTRPAELAARLIERSVQDPAELWFAGVLRLQRVPWSPLVRARKKSLGSLAHRVLASALRGAPVEGIFRELPAEPAARMTLAAELAKLRGLWPRDRYWDSFHAELAELAAGLLGQVYRLPAGRFVAVEASLPIGTALALGNEERIGIIGRMDLVRSDRPGWGGAEVDIVDFKTGGDARMSARAMAHGASLQLGVYLAAVGTLGVAGGRVWMLKADGTKPASLGLSELPEALAALGQLGRHLATGRYGALTADRTDFSHGYEWPLACAPIRHAVLARKFAATFGVPPGEATDE